MTPTHTKPLILQLIDRAIHAGSYRSAARLYPDAAEKLHRAADRISGDVTELAGQVRDGDGAP